MRAASASPTAQITAGGVRGAAVRGAMRAAMQRRAGAHARGAVRGRAARAAPAVSAPASRAGAAAAQAPPGVKVCGVTTAEDAAAAAAAGAQFVGMILWPHSKRSIDVERAREVAAAAKAGGATPVAVFVDEGAERIVEVADAVGVDHVQLHGDESRIALGDLPMRLKAVYVMSATPEGKLVTPMPGEERLEAEAAAGGPTAGTQGWRNAVDWMSRGRRTVDYILVDGQNPGSGEAFDWSKLKVPRGASRKGWILAGGLDPTNVAEAIRTCAPPPAVVDVASGVTLECGVLKDQARVEAFMEAVRTARDA